MAECRSRTYLAGMLIVMGVFLVGCKEVLYSDLTERETNEMLAVLASEGVIATRNRDKKGIYTISVETIDIAPAVMLLQAANLPREKFLSLGDIFGAEGIIATPFEQRARYVHALNQELSSTLTNLEGIRSARVLITSPPQGRYDRDPPDATASVTIEYPRDFDISGRVSGIKSIVSHAVPHLDYDDVAVALFPASDPIAVALKRKDARAVNSANILGADMSSGVIWRFVFLIVGLAALYCVMLVVLRGAKKAD